MNTSQFLYLQILPCILLNLSTQLQCQSLQALPSQF